MGFQIDLADASHAAEQVVANERQLQAAIRGALADASKDAARLVKKHVSQATGVSQRRLGVRVKMRRYQDDGSVTLWVGANPVPVHTVGTARENTRSVVAGRIVRRGAFLAKIGKGNPLRVFVREKSGHYDESLYGGESYGQGYRAKDSPWGNIKNRFPVRLGVVKIYDAVDDAIYDLDAEMQDKFDKHFMRRLNYEVVVKGAKS